MLNRTAEIRLDPCTHLLENRSNTSTIADGTERATRGRGEPQGSALHLLPAALKNKTCCAYSTSNTDAIILG